VRHEPRSPAYGRALTLFSAACTAGIPSACIAGAEQRRIGAARKIEAPEPESLWQSACDLSSPEGCAGLGERLARSKKTWDAAYTAWTRACETGEASACTDLGLFVVEKHEPAWPGEQQRSAYLSRGCDNGDAEGCYWLASDQIPKKEAAPEPAYLLLERSCQGDFGQGCAVLGQIHLDRKTSFDDELAARRFEEACDNGHFESCKTLGEMYQKGKGVEKDRVRAKEFAQRYSINARRRHLRLGAHVGFPYVAGADGEVVLPIPVGPAIAGAGSYTWLPGLGGAVLLLEGDDWPADSPPLTYWDAGLRLYPNNKARGLYAMAAWHSMEIEGADRSRSGPSLRLGMHTENKLLYSRVEMGIGQYGMVNLRDYSPDASGEFPLIQATLGLSFGIAPPI
jgi:TPR repeat protein